MKLCFGTYAGVLFNCGKEGLKRIDLLNTIVRSVDGACELTSNAVTGLFRCTTNLPNGRSNALGNVISGAMEVEPKAVSTYFAGKVVPLLDLGKYKLAVLALREIIIKDEDIAGDTVIDLVSSTTKNALRKQSEFVLADLFAGIFLYTTSINNRIGKEAAGFLTDKFMQSLFSFEKNISLSKPDVNEVTHSSREVIQKYLSNVKESYNQVKTLLFLNQPKPFYSLYVQNYVQHNFGRFNSTLIKKITAKSLTDISNFIILDGTGGTGKSMMMRHLLLNAIDEYKNFQYIPVFVTLKDYDNVDLLEFIYGEAAVFNEHLTKAMFKNGLEKGLFLLLLDGLDEIEDRNVVRFEKQLRQLTDRYNKNRYVISSRAYQTFVSFSRFTVLRVEPFTHEQAIQFIDTIEFRPDEPEYKSNFRKLLVGPLYKTHRSFIENPLLLSILLLTFEKFAGVPDKMHTFYRKAFITLSEIHDASKSSFKRIYKSKKMAEVIGDYFAEFCFHTYRDSRVEFTDEEFERYFENLRINDKTAKASDYAYDLCTNLCLMYYEGKGSLVPRCFAPLTQPSLYDVKMAAKNSFGRLAGRYIFMWPNVISRLTNCYTFSGQNI